MNKKITQKEKVEMIKDVVMLLGKDNTLWFNLNGWDVELCDEWKGKFHLYINKENNDLEMYVHGESCGKKWHKKWCNLSNIHNKHYEEELNLIYGFFVK